MGVVDALDLRLELDDQTPQLVVELVWLHLLEQHVELAPFERAGRRLLAGRADGGESLAVAERLAQAQLSGLAAADGLVGCVGAELPPRLPDLDPARAQAPLEPGD